MRGISVIRKGQATTPHKFFDMLLEKFDLCNDFALSLELDIHSGAVSRMRSGKRAINGGIVIRVHEMLGIEIKEILSWAIDTKGA